MRVLVTGAAGYIGAHVAIALEEAGHELVLLDDLSTGWEPNLRGRDCVRASLADRSALAAALSGVQAVAHLAGSALVAESVAHPERYWRNNVANGLVLLEEMLGAGVLRLVFSSSCTVYGEPDRVPIPEDAPVRPISPYGESKTAFERMLGDFGRAHGLQSIAFRYFNAAGCHESGTIGEVHEPESHLIPNVLLAIAGRAPSVKLFGTDYDTPDGTCIRDYVDVRDIAAAHVLALERMTPAKAGGDAFRTFNLGRGRGESVRDVIAACERIAGRTAVVEETARRAGDPPRLFAEAHRAEEELAWRPQHDLDDMVSTAWTFLQSRLA